MANCHPLNATTQLGFAVIGALLFLLLSQPFMYKLTNKVFKGKYVFIDAQGVPTTLGIAAHAGVFMLLVFLTMKPWQKTKYVCDQYI